MDRQRLRRGLRRTGPARRQARRPPRPAQDVRGRPAAVRRRIGCGRSFRQFGHADRIPDGTGRRRGAAGPAVAVTAGPGLPPPRTAHGHRNMDRRLGPGAGHRAAGRRAASRARGLARGVLGQRADRRAGRRPDPGRGARVGGRVRQQDRHAGSRPCHRRPRPGRGRVRPRGAPPVDRLVDADAAHRRGGAAGWLHRAADAVREPADPGRLAAGPADPGVGHHAGSWRPSRCSARSSWYRCTCRTSAATAPSRRACGCSR